MELTKIVITGGPCAGKTTAMSWIQNAFTEKGYTVLFVSETATELIRGGVAPWTCGTNVEYQKCQMRLQIEKEAIYERAARSMKVDKVLLVCDRGALDNKAYMNPQEFKEALEFVGRNEIELRDSYDAVFHLVSAAKGAEIFYTTHNNAARTETVEEARDLDDRLIAAWSGHPHFRVIDNATDFAVKMRRLVGEISSFLGEPMPYSVERKYLIEYPDIDYMESFPSCHKVEVIQTYLKSVSGNEIRIRQRGIDGHYIYFQTMERHANDIEHIEIERRLSQEEYLKLLLDADTNKKPIRKTRYCLAHKNQYFEIDVYPFWNDKAIMKINLSSEDSTINPPEGLKIIRDITNDESYRNLALASRK